MAGPGAEIGAAGLNMAASGEVLEELHPHLFGREAIKTWRNMRDGDPVVGAILFAVEMLIRQVEWRVDKEDAKDEDAEFLESCMEDMSHSWGDFISEAFSMLPYGFAFHEIVYKKRQGPQTRKGTPSSKHSDGKIGWRKLPVRAQETLDHWDFDDEGGVEAFVQKPPPDFKDRVIPMEKGLLFRTTVYKNNPEGRSILRSAYTPWYYKKRIQQIEGTGIERDLAGFPVFWLPAEFLADSASVEQKQVVAAFNNLGKNIRRDRQEHMLMPLAYDATGNKAYDFTLMNSGGSRAFNTSEIIGRYNKEIAMTVLADFILLGHETVGSFALSSDKTDLFGVALGTFLDVVADVMNRYAVPRLFALNGMDQENLPQIAHGDIEKPDLAALGAYVTAMSGAGLPLFPDEDLEAYLREAANLPEKSEEAKKAQEEQKEEPEGDELGGGGAAGPTGPSGGDLQSAIDAVRQRRAGGEGRPGAQGAGAGPGRQPGPPARG